MPASESAATVSVSHDDFAAMANLSRHTSGEILRELEADGLITLGYRSIALRDPASLRAIIND
jgi:CRP-like cAMP-binding protein